MTIRSFLSFSLLRWHANNAAGTTTTTSSFSAPPQFPTTLYGPTFPCEWRYQQRRLIRYELGI
jgi:hypothetical protein